MVPFFLFPSSGCPPLQGFESTEQNFLGVLETAVKLANQDADAGEDDDGPEEEVAKVMNQKSTLLEKDCYYNSFWRAPVISDMKQDGVESQQKERGALWYFSEIIRFMISVLGI